MEPQIRFCTTSDGVRIAFATIGEGPALVSPPGWVSHLELQWEEPKERSFYERLARHHTLVLYDKHGTGLSDRNRTDFSLEAELGDLETIIDRLELERLALFGASQGGPVAVAYAVKHPQRVTHLVLYGTYAQGGAITTDEIKASLLSLIRAHWGVGSQALADIFLPGADASTIQWLARVQRASATAEMAARLLDLVYQINVSELVPGLRVPTVVMHRQQDRVIPFELGRELAALIPNARFIPLEGNIHFPWLGDALSVLRIIGQFLGDEEEEPRPPAPPSGLVTILFTDMESSTALTQSLGDAKAQVLVRTHNTIVRDPLRAHGGTEIKHTGDGIMASFPSASSALECAVAIQRAVASHVEEQPETPLGIRIGVNTGEPIAEEQDLFGTAVQLARRICDHAEPGQILVPDAVRHIAGGKGFQFADKGDVVPKGFAEPVRVYEVRWRDE
jgi:class 3 adenylate cyclase/pimeloyl-ACP methyl ester carboxylesterase